MKKTAIIWALALLLSPWGHAMAGPLGKIAGHCGMMRKASHQMHQSVRLCETARVSRASSCCCGPGASCCLAGQASQVWSWAAPAPAKELASAPAALATAGAELWAKAPGPVGGISAYYRQIPQYIKTACFLS